MRRQAGDVLAIEHDRSIVGPDEADDQVEERALAGAIGPDYPKALSARQVEADVVGDDDLAETLVQSVDAQERCHLSSIWTAARDLPAWE